MKSASSGVNAFKSLLPLREKVAGGPRRMRGENTGSSDLLVQKSDVGAATPHPSASLTPSPARGVGRRWSIASLSALLDPQRRPAFEPLLDPRLRPLAFGPIKFLAFNIFREIVLAGEAIHGVVVVVIVLAVAEILHQPRRG